MAISEQMIDLPILLLRRLIASSTEFQQLCGASSMADALQFVHFDEALDDDSEARSRAIVYWTSWGVTKDAYHSFETESSVLQFSLELLPSIDADLMAREGMTGRQAEAFAFHGHVSKIAGQMLTNSAQDQGDGSVTTHLNVTAMNVTQLPMRIVDAGGENPAFYGITFGVPIR